MSTPRSTERSAKPGRARWALLGLAVASAAGAGAAFYQLHPDRQSVKGTCERLATALERRDSATLRSLVSPDYRDGRGLGREGVVKGLLSYLDARGYSKVRVIGAVDVKLAESAAAQERPSAHATAKVELAQATPPPRGRTDALRIELSLQRESGGWRVVSSEDYQIPTEDLQQDAAE